MQFLDPMSPFLTGLPRLSKLKVILITQHISLLHFVHNRCDFMNLHLFLYCLEQQSLKKCINEIITTKYCISADPRAFHDGRDFCFGQHCLY